MWAQFSPYMSIMDIVHRWIFQTALSDHQRTELRDKKDLTRWTQCSPSWSSCYGCWLAFFCTAINFSKFISYCIQIIITDYDCSHPGTHFICSSVQDWVRPFKKLNPKITAAGMFSGLMRSPCLKTEKAFVLGQSTATLLPPSPPEVLKDLTHRVNSRQSETKKG